jgi:hypothetical protein
MNPTPASSQTVDEALAEALCERAGRLRPSASDPSVEGVFTVTP